jgi:hypothetical protein
MSRQRSLVCLCAKPSIYGFFQARGSCIKRVSMPRIQNGSMVETWHVVEGYPLEYNKLALRYDRVIRSKGLKES